MADLETLRMSQELERVVSPVLVSIVQEYALPPEPVRLVIAEIDEYREIFMGMHATPREMTYRFLFHMVRPRRGTHEYRRRQRWLLPY